MYLVMAEEDDDAEVPQGYIEDEEQDTSESPKDPQERDDERGFTNEHLSACMKVLEALASKPAILNRRDYRDLRRAAGYYLFIFFSRHLLLSYIKGIH